MALWKILCLAFLAVIAFQGSRGLYESTEGRYVECAREMLVSGHFLEPTLEFKPHWTKPPMTYWAITGGLVVFGQNAWGARAYLILTFCLTVAAVYYLSKHLWGEDVAPFAALVYATSPFPLGAANTVNADSLLTLWETLAMFAFWAGVRRGRKPYFSLMWLFLGAAFLTKGPPGLIPLLAVLPTYWAIKKSADELPPLFPLTGLFLFAVVGLGWYLYEALLHPDLLQYWAKDEVIGRIARDEFHRNPEWYKPITIFGPLLLFGGIPWILVLAWKVKEIPSPELRWLDWGYWKERTEWLFLLLSFFLPLVVFSLSRSRLPLYVLPLFVSVTLGLGKGLHWLVSRQKLGLRSIGRLALGSAVLVAAFKGGMAYKYSSRDMSLLSSRAIAMTDSLPQKHFYFVNDNPLYGLQFYLGGKFNRVTEKPSPSASSSTLHLSELTDKISVGCSQGIVPVVLIARARLDTLKDIFHLTDIQTSSLQNSAASITSTREAEKGAGLPTVRGSFSLPLASVELRELDGKWAMVAGCSPFVKGSRGDFGLLHVDR